jgi:hypothetical protein
MEFSEKELLQLFISLSREQQNELFWTTHRLARRLQKDESTIRRMCNEGKLSAFKNLGTWLIYMPAFVEQFGDAA